MTMKTSTNLKRLGLALTAACTLAPWQASPANANPTGRFYVVACSTSNATAGAAQKAGQTVVALRDAGFTRAHLIASENFPRMQKGYLICVVDSTRDKRKAYQISHQAEGRGFSNYIARGW